MATMSRVTDIDAQIFELGRCLGVELDVEDAMTVDGTALSVTVSSRDELAGPLRIRYRGIVGLQPIEGAPYISAVLFVYSSGARLSLDGDEAGFLLWEYEPSDGGAGEWRLRGWRRDEYGEYEGFAGLPVSE